MCMCHCVCVSYSSRLSDHVPVLIFGGGLTVHAFVDFGMD